MAAKKSAGKKAASKSVPSGTVLGRILDAALADAAAVGWRDVSLETVAEVAGLSLGEVVLLVPNKVCLLRGLLDRIDARTLLPIKTLDPEETPRDRLFEILMRRFDAMNESRDAYKAVITGVARDPVAAVASAGRLERSFIAMLAGAGISTSGLNGVLYVQGLKATAAYTLRAWMSDDTSDLAKTMAALDRALNRAEKAAGMMTFRRREKAEEATDQ